MVCLVLYVVLCSCEVGVGECINCIVFLVVWYVGMYVVVVLFGGVFY